MRYRAQAGARLHAAPTARRRLTRCADVVFACACAFVVQSPGWAQTSYMALSKALTQRHREDRPLALGDARRRLHRRSLLLRQAARARVRDAAAVRRARRGRRPRSSPTTRACAPSPTAARPGRRARCRRRATATARRARSRAREAIADDAPIDLGARAARRARCRPSCCSCSSRASPSASRPAPGTAAAITLGAGTLVLPFSTLYFSHLLSALLALRGVRARLARA